MKELTLTQGKVALIDEVDWLNVTRVKWYAVLCRGKWYAATNRSRKRIYLHRFVANPSAVESVDHIDGNGLNNTRGNLRVCTHAENLRAAKSRRGISGFRGVVRHGNHWRARITVNAKNIYVGFFQDKVAAAKAYDEAARKHFGEYASLNFP